MGNLTIASLSSTSVHMCDKTTLLDGVLNETNTRKIDINTYEVDYPSAASLVNAKSITCEATRHFCLKIMDKFGYS